MSAPPKKASPLSDSLLEILEQERREHECLGAPSYDPPPDVLVQMDAALAAHLRDHRFMKERLATLRSTNERLRGQVLQAEKAHDAAIKTVQDRERHNVELQKQLDFAVAESEKQRQENVGLKEEIQELKRRLKVVR